MSLTLALLAIAALLLVLDWRQTLRIAQPGGWYERNPAIAWLIKRFGAAGVQFWFTLCAVLFAAFAYRMWDEPATVAWAAGIAAAIELACVINNLRLGIKP
jgi:hypothetical protein